MDIAIQIAYGLAGIFAGVVLVGVFLLGYTCGYKDALRWVEGRVNEIFRD